MAPRKRKKTRGPKGDGYITWDAARKRYRAVVRDGAGRAYSKYFREQADAEAWRRERLAERDETERIRVTPDATELKYAVAEWMLSRREYVAAATLSNYQQHARIIVQALGEKPMHAIWVPEIAVFDKANRADYVGHVAAQILTTLSAIFERFMALHPTTAIRNPVRAYRTITPTKARKGRPMRDKRALDPGMFRVLLRQFEGDFYHDVLLWLAVTGLRSGELRGLRRVNVRNGTALICEQRTKDNRWESTPILKTEESHRSIPIPAALLSFMPADGDLVFTNRDGGAWPQNTLGEKMRNACARAQIVPNVTPHELRHTTTAGLLNLGCPWHYVSALLGHTPVKFAASLGIRIAGQTSEYGGVGVETLRPWVDEWASLVLPEAQAVREAR